MNDCRAACKSDARITWVPAEFLEAHGVVDGDLPIWSHAGRRKRRLRADQRTTCARRGA